MDYSLLNPCYKKNTKPQKRVPAGKNITTVIMRGTYVIIIVPLGSVRTSNFIETLMVLKAHNCPVQVVY